MLARSDYMLILVLREQRQPHINHVKSWRNNPPYKVELRRQKYVSPITISFYSIRNISSLLTTLKYQHFNVLEQCMHIFYVETSLFSS